MKNATFHDRSKICENPIYERLITDLSETQYSIIDNFLSDEEIDQLRTTLLYKYHNNHFKNAGIGNKVNEVVNKAIRSDAIYWLDEKKCDTAEKVFFDKINDLSTYLNRTCFLGILQQEFHYAVYSEQHFYKRHLDSFRDQSQRKLSFVCYLNDKNWKKENGGELVLYPKKNSVEQIEVIVPFPGRIVIFESQIIEHEVRPVKKGNRLSLTGWFKTR